jgi:RNA-directed DNA polymerase
MGNAVCRALVESRCEQEDGSIVARTKGTPQGGVASPLFANIYLHHAFDKWMDEVNPQNSFERYADDIVIHCSSKEEAERLLEKLKARMQEYELQLHPAKTKMVYCKNYQRNDNHDNNSFTFLSYSFQPRTIKDKFGRKTRLLVFNAAISSQAKTSIKTKLRETLLYRWSDKSLEWFAEKLNPKIRGWVNYYMRFNRYEAYDVFYYLNKRIRKWVANKYKIRGSRKVKSKYQLIQASNPEMFYHWKLGIKA